MRGVRSSIFIVLIAFAILLVQSAFARLLAPHPWGPCLTLPFVLALGEAPGVTLVRGAATSFALGYVYDLFTGNPIGIYTLVFVLGFLVARLACRRLSFRGVTFEVGLTFVLTLAAGGLVEMIRHTFTPSGVSGFGASTAFALLASSAVTAAVSPVLFLIVRRTDPESARVSG